MSGSWEQMGVAIGAAMALSSTGVAALAASPDPTAQRAQATAIFGSLPEDAATPDRPMTESRVALGRMLFSDERLSKNHDLSCNSCHQLDSYGVDGEPTSPGHRGQRGGRNSPTVYNAALHISQFWDGREPDVEAQAKGPVLNPIEMAMPSEAAVVQLLRSIPGYRPLFVKAFPGEAEPITYDNMGTAIGAFERGLLTPSPFDRFLAGDDEALSREQLVGLSLFIQNGCTTCHNGAVIGGAEYKKIGQVKPYPTKDKGRYEVTKKESDLYVFKVPSLRNIAETRPYFHDGSVAELDQAVLLMGRHQLGIEIDKGDRRAIIAFLQSLTGELPTSYIKQPMLPESGPDTPEADPS
jgi:cytochrome c peroxidase